MPVRTYEQRPPTVQALPIAADNLGEVAELLGMTTVPELQADEAGQFFMWDQGFGPEYARRLSVGDFVIIPAMGGPATPVAGADFRLSHRPVDR